LKPQTPAEKSSGEGGQEHSPAKASQGVRMRGVAEKPNGAEGEKGFQQIELPLKRQGRRAPNRKRRLTPG